MTEKEILHRLGKARAKEQGLSFAKWCDKHGLYSHAVTPATEGKRGMSLGTLYDWCEAIGVEPWKIIYKARETKKGTTSDSVTGTLN